MVFTEKRPTKRVENYFIDSILYIDEHELTSKMTMKQIRSWMMYEDLP